eukprot:70133-Chlamydomonas_euryale.AAC.1
MEHTAPTSRLDQRRASRSYPTCRAAWCGKGKGKAGRDERSTGQEYQAKGKGQAGEPDRGGGGDERSAEEGGRETKKAGKEGEGGTK